MDLSAPTEACQAPPQTNMTIAQINKKSAIGQKTMPKKIQNSFPIDICHLRGRGEDTNLVSRGFSVIHHVWERPQDGVNRGTVVPDIVNPEKARSMNRCAAHHHENPRTESSHWMTGGGTLGKWAFSYPRISTSPS